MSVWPSTKAARVLAALKRIGWQEKRQKGSHLILSRPGWGIYVWAYHGGEEIGPARLAAIGKETGLTPGEL